MTVPDNVASLDRSRLQGSEAKLLRVSPAVGGEGPTYGTAWAQACENALEFQFDDRNWVNEKGDQSVAKRETEARSCGDARQKKPDMQRRRRPTPILASFREETCVAPHQSLEQLRMSFER